MMIAAYSLYHRQQFTVILFIPVFEFVSILGYTLEHMIFVQRRGWAPQRRVHHWYQKHQGLCPKGARHAHKVAMDSRSRVFVPCQNCKIWLTYIECYKNINNLGDTGVMGREVPKLGDRWPNETYVTPEPLQVSQGPWVSVATLDYLLNNLVYIRLFVKQLHYFYYTEIIYGTMRRISIYFSDRHRISVCDGTIFSLFWHDTSSMCVQHLEYSINFWCILLLINSNNQYDVDSFLSDISYL